MNVASGPEAQAFVQTWAGSDLNPARFGRLALDMRRCASIADPWTPSGTDYTRAAEVLERAAADEEARIRTETEARVLARQIAREADEARIRAIPRRS